MIVERGAFPRGSEVVLPARQRKAFGFVPRVQFRASIQHAAAVRPGQASGISARLPEILIDAVRGV